MYNQVRFRIKRQQTIAWPPNRQLDLRKSKSLPDTTSALCEKVRNVNINAEECPQRADKSKKKKKKGKFSKKAKAVSNAKIFVTPQRD